MRMTFAAVVFISAAAISALAQGAADLVPDITQLPNGTITVINQGKHPSALSRLTIVCHKKGGGSCAESPAMAAYENPAYPNAVTVDVPAIDAGGNYSHVLTFWDQLKWAPGTYSLAVKVDVAGVVAESNEANNKAVAQKVVLPAVQKIPTPFNTAVAAGLPDLITTSLGFVIGDNGPTPFGGTATVSLPQSIEQTQVGPNHDLCNVKTSLFRTFNKGDFAAGSFTNLLYRHGTLVYTRHIPSLGPKQTVEFENTVLPLKEGMNTLTVKLDANHVVPESDESNTYIVHVNVKHDCNGDGVAPGALPKIKNASPSQPTQPSVPRMPVNDGRQTSFKTR